MATCKLRLLLFVCLTAYIEAMNVGPVTIKEFGENVERYVVSTNATGVVVDGSTIKLPHNAQVQIAWNGSFNESYSPYMYREYILKDRTLSFTMDLSEIGCSCNAAFYLSSMPGYAANNQPDPGDFGNYYCDANDVSGVDCWEMDVMEANKYSMQITPHECSSPPGQYIASCDGAGCATNLWKINYLAICPNSSCTINTMQPFRLSMNFGDNNISVSLTQNNEKLDFLACWFITDYLNEMQQAFEYGMVMIMSYWGSTWDVMEWLDKYQCTGDCDGSGQAIFSDIEIA